MNISITRIRAHKNTEAIAVALHHILQRHGVQVDRCAAVWRDGRAIIAVHHRGRSSRRLDALVDAAASAAVVATARPISLFAAA